MMTIRDVRDSIGLRLRTKLVSMSLKDLFDPILFRFQFLLLAIPMSSLSNAKYISVKKDPTLVI